MVAITLFAAAVGIGAGVLDARLAPAAPTSAQGSTLGVDGASARVTDVRAALHATVLAREPDATVPSGPVACAPAAGYCLTTALEGTTRVALSTTDGGARWQVHPLPAVASSTALAVASIACPSSSVCIIAGTGFTHGEVLATSDGGRGFHAAVLPSSLRTVSAVSCTSASTCLLAGARPATSSGSAEILRTTDSGRTWSEVVGPPRLVDVNALACTPAGLCLLGGEGAGRTTSASGLAERSAVVYATRNIGRSWSVVPLRAPSTSAVGGLTCASDGACTGITIDAAASALGLFQVDGAGRAAKRLAPLPATVTYDGGGTLSVGCASESLCLLAAGSSLLLATTDGGASWHDEPLQRSGSLSRPIARSVACSAALCVVPWFSILPDRSGIARATPAAIASLRAPGATGDAKRSAFTDGVLPGGVGALTVACDSTGACIVGAVGSGTAAVLGGAAASGRTATELSSIRLPARRGYSSPLVRSLSCAGSVCGVQVSEQRRNRSLLLTASEFVGIGAAGTRLFVVSAPPRASLGLELSCLSASRCVASAPASRRPTLELSSDGGSTWRAVAPPLGTNSSATEALGQCPTPRLCVAAAPSSSAGAVLVSRSTNGGSGWKSLRSGLGAGAAAEVQHVSCDAAGTCAVEATSTEATYVVVVPPSGPAHETGFAAAGATFLAPVACERTTCFAPAVIGRLGGVLSTTDAGKAWRFEEAAGAALAGVSGHETEDAFSSRAAVDCISPTTCIFVVPTRAGQEIERVTLTS